MKTLKPDFQLWDKADIVPLYRWRSYLRFRLSTLDLALVSLIIGCLITLLVR